VCHARLWCSNRSPDSRRAIFHVGNSTYSSKLVDLPCIIEAQKTLDNKQMFKVADICQVCPASAVPLRPGLTGAQMLVVEDRIENEQALNNSKTFNLDEYIWPHGITPPLHHVRKRRFRKRANKRVRPVHGGLNRALTSLLFRPSRAWSRRWSASSKRTRPPSLLNTVRRPGAGRKSS
jgi:TATA-binding protein-associated factor Taf7